MLPLDSPSSAVLNEPEKRYLQSLNTTFLKTNSLAFRLHLDQERLDRQLLWKIVRYRPGDTRFSKAHRNALLLLNESGTNLNNGDFYKLRAPDLDFRKPPCFANSNLSNCFLPYIKLTGACLNGTDFRKAILTGAQFGLYHLCHDNEIKCIAIHENYVATIDSTQTLCLWDYTRGVIVYQQERIKKLQAQKICFSIDGNFLFIIEKRKQNSRFTLAVWKCIPLEQKLTHHLASKFSDNLEPVRLVCSNDKKYLIAVFREINEARINEKKGENCTHTLRVWKIVSKVNFLELDTVVNRQIPQVFEHFSLSPSSEIFATCTNNANTAEIVFCDLLNFKILGKWVEAKPLLSITFASDGYSLVLVEHGKDGGMNTYTRNLKTVQRFDLFEDTHIEKIVFGYSTSLFTYFTDKQNICVRSIYDRRVLARLRIEEDELQDLYFSSSENELIGRCKKIIKIWQISEISKFWKSPFDEGIQGIAFSRDSAKITILGKNDTRVVNYVTSTGVILSNFILGENNEKITKLRLLSSMSIISNYGDTIIFHNELNSKNKMMYLFSLFSESIYCEINLDNVLNFCFSITCNHVVLFRQTTIDIYYTRKKNPKFSFNIERMYQPNSTCQVACMLNKEREGYVALIESGKLDLFHLRNDRCLIQSYYIFHDCISMLFVGEGANQILALHNGICLELRSLPEFLIVQTYRFSKKYDVSPAGNFVVNYLYLQNGSQEFSELTGHIIQVFSLDQKKSKKNISTKILEFNVDFSVTGIKCAPNGKNFAIWNSEQPCFQIYTIEDGSLVWQEPLQLQIKDVKTVGLIADELTESILHYPRIKPSNMEEIRILMEEKPSRYMRGKAKKVIQDQINKKKSSPDVHINALEIATINLWNFYLDEFESMKIYFPFKNFQLLIGLRFFEIERLDKLLIHNSAEIFNVIDFHISLLEEEYKRIDKFFSLITKNIKQFLWLNYDWKAFTDKAIEKLHLPFDNNSFL